MISVIVTAFNAERHIVSAIRSILGQSYQDLQCIIADDGSSDGTYKAASFISDIRLSVIRCGRIGRGKALNVGIRASNGEWVAIQDADDISHRHRLTTEFIALSSDPSLSAVGSGHMLIGDEDPEEWEIPGALRVSDRVVHRALPYRNPISHTSLMIRRSALESIGGYDENRTCLYDWDLLVRLCASGVKVGRISAPLVAHRIHGGQFFEGRRRLRYAFECAKMQKKAIRELGRNRLLNLSIPPIFGYRVLSRWS